MNEEDLFAPLSPEEPYLFETGVSVFGGADDPVDFLYGGTSTLPSGDINPEDFAKFPAELFRNGYVQPGGAYRVINPKTKKMAVVIARHADDAPKAGLGLAPQTYLELGQADKYIIDFRPIPPEKYPRAMYPPTIKRAAQTVTPTLGEAAAAGDDASGLGDVSIEGRAPETGGGPIDEPEPSWLKDEETGEEYRVNPDGSETYRDGRTFYDDGAWTRPLGKKVVAWAPGMKTPAVIDMGKDKEPKVYKTKDDRFMQFKDGKMVEVPMPKGLQQSQGVNYADEKASRVIQSVNELEGKVNRYTSGWRGVIMNKIPETKARNFKAELDTLKANIAFGELTEMRNASKTGGALGQVSNIELGLLQSSLGALDVGQSPENLKQQLAKIRESIKRWNEIKRKHAGELVKSEPSATPSATPASPPKPDTKKEALKDEHGFIPGKIYPGENNTFAKYLGNGEWAPLP